MEEITSAVAVPFTLGNLTGLKLMANSGSAFILNPPFEGSESFSVASENNSGISPHHQIKASLEVKENQVGNSLVSKMVQGDKKEDESLLAKGFNCSNSPISQSVSSEKRGSPYRDEPAILRTNCCETNSAITIKVGDKSSLKEPQAEVEKVKNMVSVGMEIENEDGSGSDGSDPKPCLELSSNPLCGFSTDCGKRDEMEDAIAVKPRLFHVPSWMPMDDHVNEYTKHSEAHFFGVYDGHGGSQVANYCRDHLHSVLIKEIEAAESSLDEKKGRENWEEQWKKVFSNCFHRVDDEVSGIDTSDFGTESSIEPLASDAVGSTAVVAILSQTHIIVANCGDSRAVLLRGKDAVPLSSDHKPNREDEWARIEAAGGRVIQWNGYRVLGVLAVSRSIGDRYLKPWIIAEPEVKCIHREKTDECLILASDGLWDVITNEEACEIARKRILVWHKKNMNNNSSTRQIGLGGVDPAAQYASEYLSKLALQRGSKDNISVIVIDLKAQRKIKTKS